MLPLALGVCFPQICISVLCEPKAWRQCRVSEAPSIRAEPRPAVAQERPTFFFACADLLCPHFQGFAKSPTTYLWTQTLPLSDLGQPMRHTQASVFPGKSLSLFPWDCSLEAHKCSAHCRLLHTGVLDVPSSEGLYLGALTPSHSALDSVETRGQSLLHCLADIAWGLKKKLFENQNSHFFFLFLIWILEHKSINFINVHVMPWIAHFICKRGFRVS